MPAGIKLSALESAAIGRPSGYYDDVLSRGVVIGDSVHLTDEAKAELRRKYSTFNQWPTWAATIAKLKADGDTGIGDTIARVIGPVGGAAFKRYFKTIFGKSCGCDERQDALNRRYPYVDASPSMNG